MGAIAEEHSDLATGLDEPHLFAALDAVEHRVLVVLGRHAELERQALEAADQQRVVRAERGPRPLRARLGAPQPLGHPEELLVHVALVGECQLRGLGVGALDDAHRRPERQERLEVVGMRLVERPVERQRRVRVGAPLHVDPEPAAVDARGLGQRAHVRGAERRIDVEPELRGLHGHLGVQVPAPDAVERAEVVREHRVGLGPVAQVLAEVRERDGDAEPVLFARGDQRFVERLARHEAAHGEFHESAARHLALEPGAAGTRQQQTAHRIHGAASVGWMRR